MARISYLLQRDDNHLSLRRVAERLGLQFEQVKKLCGDKLELLKGNARRENGCHRIFEHDNFYVFKQSEQFVVSNINGLIPVADKGYLYNGSVPTRKTSLPYPESVQRMQETLVKFSVTDDDRSVCLWTRISRDLSEW